MIQYQRWNSGYVSRVIFGVTEGQNWTQTEFVISDQPLAYNSFVDAN